MRRTESHGTKHPITICLGKRRPTTTSLTQLVFGSERCKTMTPPNKVSPTGAPVAHTRRKSSLQLILAEFEEPANRATMPRQMSTQSSTVNSYDRLKTAEERVAFGLRKYQREVLEVHGTRESTLSFNEQTISDFMERQKANGLSESDELLLYRRLLFLQIGEKQEYNPYRILSLLFKTMMGYVDIGTDIATMVFYATVNVLIAKVQGGILAFSFVCQCLTSLALGQPWWVGMLGLIGMKPAVEAWRDATGARAFEGQRGGNDKLMWVCRVTEMVVSGCFVRALLAWRWLRLTMRRFTDSSLLLTPYLVIRPRPSRRHSHRSSPSS